MSLFAAGQIGGRGTWIPSSKESKQVGKQRRLSWESATESEASPSATSSSSKLTPSKSPSDKSFQNRMATIQAGIQVRRNFGSLTVTTSMSTSERSRFQPHSPNSSPPPTPTPNPISDDWNETQTESDVMEVAPGPCRSNAGTPTLVNWLNKKKYQHFLLFLYGLYTDSGTAWNQAARG